MTGYKDGAISFAYDLDDDGAYEIYPPRAANKSLIRINAGFGFLEFPRELFAFNYNLIHNIETRHVFARHVLFPDTKFLTLHFDS